MIRAKKYVIQYKGVTLVEVPCWWDGTSDSLSASVHFQRPDLCDAPTVDPIPLNPPLDYFPTQEIPGVGELMLASHPETNFTILQSDTTWWMGEKYDGIRCCWNPVVNGLYTRGGRMLPVIPQISNLLPSTLIDAEIWFGRGMFYSTNALSSNSGDFVNWPALRLMAFDIPSREFRNKSFEKRYKHLLKTIPSAHPITLVAPRVFCDEDALLTASLKDIIDDDGEGVILRKTGSLYYHGRSPALIKLKYSSGDMEGIVVGIGNDKSVQVKTPNGIAFTVPPTSVRVETPTVGEVVTFSYTANSRREVPVGPIIERVRTDLSWEDVLFSAAKDGQLTNDRTVSTSKPMKHWTDKNMRLFFETFAKNRGVDPLVPETWYNIPPEDITKLKSGRTILRKFNGYTKALKNLFPEVDFNMIAFPRAAWYDIANRRNFFESYASENEFDPLVPDNWYAQSIEKIISHKGVNRIIHYHNYSVPKALVSLFPNIGLDISKFSQTLFRDREHRRLFFEKYAKERQFDPLNIENWYSHPRESILAQKDGIAVVKHFQGSVINALCDSFPELPWDKSTNSLWRSPDSRRRFFERYAKMHGFNPYVPDNWYTQSRDKILSVKGASRILYYHNDSVTQALTDLFPNIGLDKSKFQWNKSMWHEESFRREFFINYAKVNHFDPLIPENWYSHPREKLMTAKGFFRVISFHKSSLPQALFDLFPDIGINKTKFTLKTSVFQFPEARKEFLENFAKENGFDPTIPSNWYTLSRTKLLASKEIGRVLHYHNNSLAKALGDLFPEIGIDRAKFTHRSVWHDPLERQNFFENYAKQNGFDPLKAEDWYLQPVDRMMMEKGITSVIYHHKHNVLQALTDLFPNIGLDKTKFLASSAWFEKSARRKFFEDYAKKNEFNPLHPRNWYSRMDDIVLSKGVHKVLYYHNKNVTQALLDLFPDIGLRFTTKEEQLKLELERREVFNQFAKQHKFDPLIAENWHSVSLEKLLSFKGTKRILKNYKNNVVKALTEAYPNLQIEKSRFNNVWNDSGTRRKVLENYAIENGFDPLLPDNWYSQSSKKIMAFKGIFGVVSYHKGSIQRALIDLFPNVCFSLKHWN